MAAGGRAADWAANYNVAPTQRAPIVRELVDDAGTLEREIELATWGFWPFFVKAGDKRPHPINARMETVATNGMFRQAFTSTRAAAPMRGYYEWEERILDGKTIKQPHFILPFEGDLLSAAALYTTRRDEATGEKTTSYTIITREARDASGEIHDRMPVFLTRDALAEWLNPAKIEDDPEGTLGMLDRSSLAIASTIVTYPVSRAVNNVRTADPRDPELIAPLDEE